MFSLEVGDNRELMIDIPKIEGNLQAEANVRIQLESGEGIKKVSFKIFARCEWPRLWNIVTDWHFRPDEVGKYTTKLLAFNSSGNLRIEDIISSDPSTVDIDYQNARFPIEANSIQCETFGLMVNAPVKSEHSVDIIFITNEECGRTQHTIKWTACIPDLIIRNGPIIKLGTRLKTQNEVSLTNVGSETADVKLELPCKDVIIAIKDKRETVSAKQDRCMCFYLQKSNLPVAPIQFFLKFIDVKVLNEDICSRRICVYGPTIKESDRSGYQFENSFTNMKMESLFQISHDLMIHSESRIKLKLLPLMNAILTVGNEKEFPQFSLSMSEENAIKDMCRAITERFCFSQMSDSELKNIIEEEAEEKLVTAVINLSDRLNDKMKNPDLFALLLRCSQEAQHCNFPALSIQKMIQLAVQHLSLVYGHSNEGDWTLSALEDILMRATSSESNSGKLMEFANSLQSNFFNDKRIRFLGRIIKSAIFLHNSEYRETLPNIFSLLKPEERVSLLDQLDSVVRDFKTNRPSCTIVQELISKLFAAFPGTGELNIRDAIGIRALLLTVFSNYIVKPFCVMILTYISWSSRNSHSSPLRTSQTIAADGLQAFQDSKPQDIQEYGSKAEEIKSSETCSFGRHTDTCDGSAYFMDSEEIRLSETQKPDETSIQANKNETGRECNKSETSMKQMDGSVPQEHIINNIKDCLECANDMTENLKSNLSDTSININDMLKVMNSTHQICFEIERITSFVFHDKRSIDIISNIPDDTFLNAAEICVQIHGVIHIYEKKWKRRRIKGEFIELCKKLRKRIVRVLDLITDTMGEAGEQFILECARLHIKLSKFPKRFQVTGMSLENAPESSKFDKSLFSLEKIVTDSGEQNKILDPIDQDIVDSDNSASVTDSSDVNRSHYRYTKPSKKHNGNSNSETKLNYSDTSDFKEVVFSLDTPDPGDRESLRLLDFPPDFMERMRQQDKHRKLRQTETINEVAQFSQTEDSIIEVQVSLDYMKLLDVTRRLQSQIMKIFRSRNLSDGKALPEPTEKQKLKFVFLVDNSGSMHGENMTLLMLILTVFLEVLKRLEFDSAVVRFGGEKSQKCLKRFETEMTPEIGASIVAQLDASEKTLTADGLRSVYENIFMVKPKDNEHRFIIIITDGFWSQINSAVYQECLGKMDACAFVIVTNLNQNDEEVFGSRNTLDSFVRKSQYRIDSLKDLPGDIRKIAKMIKEMVFDVTEKTSQKGSGYTFSDLRYPDITTRQDKQTHVGDNGNMDNEWRKTISLCAKQIDRNMEESCYKAFVSDFSINFKSKRNRYSDVDPHTALTLASVIEDEEKLQEHLINEVEEALDIYVFPDNFPTRWIQDFRGQKLSIPGIIRYFCTGGDYKKIFENFNSYPKKHYLISVILDTSSSMYGMAAQGARRIFITLSASLQRLDIQYNLMSCGTDTNILKSFEEEWDRNSKARANVAFHYDDKESNIGDSIMYATELLRDQGSSKAVKMIFVITDGYDSSPERLRMSLAYSDSHRITVVGIGVGYLSNAVSMFFPRSLILGDPQLLAEGLEKLFSDSVNEGSNDEDEVIDHEEEAQSQLAADWNKAIEDNMIKNSKSLQRYVSCIQYKLVDLSIDLCYVIDTTGSMHKYMESVKKYSKKLTEDIKYKLQNRGKSLKFRIGYVGYKYFYSDGHKISEPFTENIDSIVQFMSGLEAEGGAIKFPYQEDKCGGLEVALDMEWNSPVKFLALIGDREDHTFNCEGCNDCEDARKSRNSRGIPDFIKELAEKEIHLLYVTVNDLLENEKNKVKEVYKNASLQLKENGFLEVDISGEKTSDNSDVMMSKLQEKIVNVLFWDFM